MDKKRPDKQYLHNWVKNPNHPLLDNRITKNPNINTSELVGSWINEFGGNQPFEQFTQWQRTDINLSGGCLPFANDIVEQHLAYIEQEHLERNLFFLGPYIDAAAQNATIYTHEIGCLEEPTETAFAELIVPFSRAVFNQWKLTSNLECKTFFDPIALKDIFHWIVKRIDNLLSPILYDNFNKKRTQEQLIQSYKEKKRSGQAPSSTYNSFIQEIRLDLEIFLRKNPGLVNILCKTIKYSQRALALLSERLTTHRQAIQKTFLQDKEQFKITRISIGEGDTHDQGLSVAIITIKAGSTETKIVYKPRSIDLDHQFYQLCKILENRYNASPTNIYPKTLPTKDFGFIQYIDNDPCRNAQDLSHFYHNFGRLLCLSRMLSGTDIHYENLIASGMNAVLIDCETLFTPTFKTILHPFDDFPEENVSMQLIRSSVMATMMLPKWVYKGAEKLRLDMSAVGVSGGDDGGKSYVKSWFEQNTDLMMPSMVESEETTIRSLPVGAYTANPAPDFVENICNGFTELYQHLKGDQSFWLEDSSPLHLFKGKKHRVVFRATDFYARILSDSIKPHNLRSETHRQASLHKLSRAFTQCKNKPDSLNIFEEEVLQLTRGDIPAFYSKTDSDILFTETSHDIDHSLIQKSGIETVYNLFQNMSDQDLVLQLTLIKGSLDARFSTTGQTINCIQSLCSAVAPTKQSDPTHKDKKDKRVSTTLAYSKSLLLQDNDEVYWIGHQVYFGKKGISFFLANDDLPQGRLGICCSLASLELSEDTQNSRYIQSLIASCVAKIYTPFANASKSDFRTKINISPGLNGITGHLLGSKLLIEWCNKTQNKQLEETLEKSAKVIVEYCSNHGTFLNVDCHGSLYTSAYALFNFLPQLKDYFQPGPLNNCFQEWIRQLEGLKPDALSLRYGHHEGTLGMLRVALKNSKRLSHTQSDYLKDLFLRASQQLLEDIDCDTSLSISDGLSGTLVSIADSYRHGWMDQTDSTTFIKLGLQHLHQELIHKNRELSHDLAYGYSGLNWMLNHLNNLVDPQICQQTRLELEQHCQQKLYDIDDVTDFKTINKSVRYQALGPITGVLGIENHLDKSIESNSFVDTLMAL